MSGGVDGPRPRPGRMHVEAVLLTTGERGLDFVIPGRSVPEIFSARLIHGTRTLEVTWTASLGRETIVGRIAMARRLAGPSGDFERIVGYASDEFREQIRLGKINIRDLALTFDRRLGGSWRVEFHPRSGSIPPTWNVSAIRVGD